MPDALIGHTGFVGSNIADQAEFEATYNSSNIEAIEGESFRLIVCAGAPGTKWKANREPERDNESISRMMRSLDRSSAEHVVLISTVDVYPVPHGVDEDSSIELSGNSPYGSHRFLLESFVRDRFESTVVRLPGLFGPRLKKNIIYDFLNENLVGAISPESAFQFYPIARLWEDIETTRRLGLSLVNFATEPTTVRRVASEVFGIDFENPDAPHPVSYDVRTKHAAAFGRSGPYLFDGDEILSSLRDYVRSERAVQP